MEKQIEGDIKVQSSEVLYKLYLAFEDLGMVHHYSEELGELNIKLGQQWFTFYVDPAVLKEELMDRAWLEDSYQVAEGYWRQ